MSDLVMTFSDKKLKKKANSDDKYYNCYKFGHFRKDCFFPDRRLNRTT